MYISQSVLCVPLFYGSGFGAYAWIGQRGALLLGVVFWIMLVAAAHAWMRRFHDGRPAQYRCTSLRSSATCRIDGQKPTRTPSR